MSYSTLNRFCEPSHQYNPGDAGVFIPGSWWPDFGPGTYDFSEQYKMHPTNTIFRNVLAMPRERGQLADKAPEEAKRLQPGPQQQFRRNLPTEALYKSVIIQPCKKGAHVSEGRERANYQAACVQTPPALRRECEAFETHLARSRSTPALGASTLPTSLARLREERGATRTAGRSTLGVTLASSSLGGAEVPAWVADQTIASRPPDAAGHAGTTQHAHCRTTSATGRAHATLAGGASGLAEAAVAHRDGRSRRWAALANPSSR